MGYLQHFSITASVAVRMDCGVPLRNSPAGSTLPMATMSEGMWGIISAMSIALPKWRILAPTERMESMVRMVVLPQLW